MIDAVIYDDPAAEISRLHDEAEELAAEARYADPARARRLRARAQTKVRQAARLRARYDEEV